MMKSMFSWMIEQVTHLKIKFSQKQNNNSNHIIKTLE